MDTGPWQAWMAGGTFAALLLGLGLGEVRLRRERRVSRQALADLQHQLESQREEFEMQLRTATEQAGKAIEASERRSRFLAAASHDLRQPIHAITLFGEALASEPLPASSRQLVDRLHRSLSGLDELFNRLLDISRIDVGTIDPQFAQIPLAPMLQSLEARFASIAAERGLQWRVRTGTLLQVRSDPTLLVEMVMNLLSNAFRYTTRGGVLVAARRRQRTVLLQVWDTGRGIPAAQLESVFGEFVQLDNPSRDRRRGLGLGLAIVRRLAQSLGHQVNVRSRPGRGSVFEIELPLVELPASVAPPADRTEARHDLAGLLVLAVDDEIEVLVATEALLTRWGCYTLLARSIPEALERLDASERFPDVLLTDHALANGVTGFDVANAVIESVPQELRIAVLSGDADRALEQSVQARHWTFMAKPVNPRRLREFLAATA